MNWMDEHLGDFREKLGLQYKQQKMLTMLKWETFQIALHRNNNRLNKRIEILNHGDTEASTH